MWSILFAIKVCDRCLRNLRSAFSIRQEKYGNSRRYRKGHGNSRGDVERYGADEGTGNGRKAVSDAGSIGVGI